MLDKIRIHGSSIGWISLTVLVLFGMARCTDTNPQGTGDAWAGIEGVILYDKDGQLFRYSQGNTTQITTVGGDEGKWSPNGSQIVFDSNRDGDGEIWVINEDGTTSRQLTSNSADDEEPAWSPDSTLIVFGSNRDGNNEIYVMNAADGTNQRRLTNNPASDKHPIWSPDGTTIAFDSNRDGNRQIYVMNAADGTNQMNLSSSSTNDSNPDWSPDGTKIAFARDGDIFIMDAGGTNPVNFTNSDFDDSDPVWSPDGTQIMWLLNSSDPYTTSGLYYMDSDGTGEKKPFSRDATDPDWKELTH